MEALREPRTLSPPVEAYISADEFWHMSNSPDYADCNSELVEGRVIDMSKPKPLHGIVASKVVSALLRHVEQREVGTLFVSEVGYVLERRPSRRDTVRGVDISYLSEQKTASLEPHRWFEGAPDLAIEVISPGNQFSDINLKTRQLLDAGAQAVWIVDPATRSVQIHSPQGFTVLREGDALSGGDILPGFSIKVADIFPA